MSIYNCLPEQLADCLKLVNSQLHGDKDREDPRRFYKGEANALRADLLGDFMSSGIASGRVSIAIFDNEGFLADRFVGNDAGGFREIEKEA